MGETSVLSKYHGHVYVFRQSDASLTAIPSEAEERLMEDLEQALKQDEAEVETWRKTTQGQESSAACWR
jgi:hypothetical protein